MYRLRQANLLKHQMTFPKRESLSSWARVQKCLLPPKLITFDAYNTLYCSTIPVMEQYALIALKYNIIENPNDLVGRFTPIFKKLSTLYPNYGKHSNISADQWWTLLIKELFKSHLVPQEMIREILARFKTNEAYTAYPDVIEFIKAIKSRYPNVILGIISNTDPAAYDLLESLGLFQHFIPYTYFSYDLDMSKPDTKLFDYVIDDVLKRQPDLVATTINTSTTAKQLFLENCWHIGDELEKDMLAAQNAGWNAILVDRLDRNGFLNNISSRADMTEHDLQLDKIDQHAENIWDFCRDRDELVQLNEKTFVVPNIRVVTRMFLQE